MVPNSQWAKQVLCQPDIIILWSLVFYQHWCSPFFIPGPCHTGPVLHTGLRAHGTASFSGPSHVEPLLPVTVPHRRLGQGPFYKLSELQGLFFFVKQFAIYALCDHMMGASLWHGFCLLCFVLPASTLSDTQKVVSAWRLWMKTLIIPRPRWCLSPATYIH